MTLVLFKLTECQSCISNSLFILYLQPQQQRQILKCTSIFLAHEYEKSSKSKEAISCLLYIIIYNHIQGTTRSRQTTGEKEKMSPGPYTRIHTHANCCMRATLESKKSVASSFIILLYRQIIHHYNIIYSLLKNSSLLISPSGCRMRWP